MPIGRQQGKIFMAVSFSPTYRVGDEETLYAKAASTMVPYNLETKHPRRLTEAERGFLTVFTE